MLYNNYILAKVLFHYNLINNNSYISETVKIVCPFHEDLNPSLLANLNDDRFYCFGCNKSGNHIDIIKKMEKCTGIEAIKFANNLLGETQKSDKIFVPKISAKPSIEHLKDAWHYYNTLPVTDWKKLYQEFKLKKVSVNIKEMEYLARRGFSPTTLMKNQVKINYNNTYEIICPIFDNGKFKGYVCRSTKQIKRKYLYNAGFSRKNTLLGNYTKDSVIITEGYFDWLKLKQKGLNNCVAILGWKITDQQISKLQKCCKVVISALDNTETGEMGTKRLMEYFQVIKFPFPNSIKDIGEMDDFNLNRGIILIKSAQERKT